MLNSSSIVQNYNKVQDQEFKLACGLQNIPKKVKRITAGCILIYKINISFVDLFIGIHLSCLIKQSSSIRTPPQPAI